MIKIVSTYNLTQGISVFFYLTIVAVTLLFFDKFGLPAAGTYLTITFVTLFLLFFGFFQFKESNYISDLIPFNQNIDRSILVYVLGIIIPLGAFILGATLFKLSIIGFNFYNPLIMAPLAASDIEPTSFQALKLKASPTTQWFTETIGAPTLEEILIGFGFVIISAFLTVYLITVFLMLTLRQKASVLLSKVKTYKKTILTGAIIGSVLIFMGIHVFNDTYVKNPNLFLDAGIFRLVINMLIFAYLKLGIEFGIAVHEINNTLAYIFHPKTGVGMDGYLTSITTPVGLLLFSFMILLPILIVVMRWQYMRLHLKDIGKALIFIKKGSFKN